MIIPRINTPGDSFILESSIHRNATRHQQLDISRKRLTKVQLQISYQLEPFRGKCHILQNPAIVTHHLNFVSDTVP